MHKHKVNEQTIDTNNDFTRGKQLKVNLIKFKNNIKVIKVDTNLLMLLLMWVKVRPLMIPIMTLVPLSTRRVISSPFHLYVNTALILPATTKRYSLLIVEHPLMQSRLRTEVMFRHILLHQKYFLDKYLLFFT